MDDFTRLIRSLCVKMTRYRYLRHNRIYNIDRAFIIATMEHPLDLDGSETWHSKVKQIKLPYRFRNHSDPTIPLEKQADRYLAYNPSIYADFERWLLLTKLV